MAKGLVHRRGGHHPDDPQSSGQATAAAKKPSEPAFLLRILMQHAVTQILQECEDKRVRSAFAKAAVVIQLQRVASPMPCEELEDAVWTLDLTQGAAKVVPILEMC